MKIECRTQEELDKALAKKAEKIWLRGDRFFVLKSGQVVAREASRVDARDSSQVVAAVYSQVHAWDSSVIEAGRFCAVTIYDKTVKAKGGVQIWVSPAKTAEEWCELWGVPVKKGAAVLYKAIKDNFMSPLGCNFTPGTIPKCSDWDGGKKECGGGLHFVPHPTIGQDFFNEATKFVACPVKVKEIVVHENATFPQKVKAPGGCAPCWEVNRWGEKVNP